MEKLSVAEARRAESVGKIVLLQGWVRTRRDSKGGFSFIELNDGSCFGNVQIVADGQLAEYETVVKHLTTGCSAAVEGEVKASPAKGQQTEIAATKVTLLGSADAESYPLQKKQTSFEFLRTIAHLRPRTNTFGAIARVRNCVSRSIHAFFQEQGFLYVHTPVITAGDCEGAGAMFRVSTIDPAKPTAKSTSRKTSSSDRPISPSAGSCKAKRSRARSARSTRSAPRFGPRTPTRRGTWPSFG